MLEGDSTTDWTRVNLEALRQHLIDMDLVVMGANVEQSNVEGGLKMRVTGDAATARAITRMLPSHATMLNADTAWVASTSAIQGGMELTLAARNRGDTKLVQRIRGLGFIGILTQGNHHGAHHMMIA